jgi:Domain of unknown function (DUF3597)
MSILGSIISKVFHHGSATTAAPTQTQIQAQAQTATAATTSTAASTQAAPRAAQPVDVEAVLDALDEKNPQELDWRHSIVDLMKLLNLDSSHAARIELAKELHYSGNTADSYAMNIWLHAQVMKKLAENGGIVPEELKKH